MDCKTPDGLAVHELRGVGLVVSASEHNRKVAQLIARMARLQHALMRRHREQAYDMPGYMREALGLANTKISNGGNAGQ